MCNSFSALVMLKFLKLVTWCQMQEELMMLNSAAVEQDTLVYLVRYDALTVINNKE